MCLRETDDYRAFLKKKAEIEAKIETKAHEEVDAFLSKERSNSGDYLLAAHDAGKLAKDTPLDTFAGERKIQPSILRRWMKRLDSTAATNDPVFGAWLVFSALPEKEFAARAQDVAAQFSTSTNGGSLVNPLVARALADGAPNSLKG